jgi:hypothetical protein
MWFEPSESFNKNLDVKTFNKSFLVFFDKIVPKLIKLKKMKNFKILKDKKF